MVKTEVCLDNFNKAKKGDILIFDGKIWNPSSCAEIIKETIDPIISELNEQKKKVSELSTKVRRLELQIAYDHGEIDNEQFIKEISKL